MCSFRSCPTQNARPVPVSTTQRTAVSSAARVTASSSASLVATSRLFIASGRFSVMVATPSATAYSTGESVIEISSGAGAPPGASSVCFSGQSAPPRDNWSGWWVR